LLVFVSSDERPMKTSQSQSPASFFFASGGLESISTFRLGILFRIPRVGRGKVRGRVSKRIHQPPIMFSANSLHSDLAGLPKNDPARGWRVHCRFRRRPEARTGAVLRPSRLRNEGSPCAARLIPDPAGRGRCAAASAVCMSGNRGGVINRCSDDAVSVVEASRSRCRDSPATASP